MKRGAVVLVASGLLLAAGIGLGWAAGFAELSGLWSGTKKNEASGVCKRQGDSEAPAALDLKVQEDGQVVAKDALGRRLEGAIGNDLSVNLVLKAKSRCQVNGEFQEHEWTAQYTGQVLQAEGSYQMTLVGTEEPCDQCRFKVEYTLGKK
jgi:hypothetical protein